MHLAEQCWGARGPPIEKINGNTDTEDGALLSFGLFQYGALV
jgi:hypothetical protein